MESTERRGVERFDLDLPARIRVTAPEQPRDEIELRTENVSCGGAFFKTSQPLPEGTVVDVDLILDLEKLKEMAKGVGLVRIELKGTVSRSEPTGMSVCFHSDYRIEPWQGEPER